MEKRRLGRTDYYVSVIGLGGIPIQKVDEDGAVEILESAYENGINFIDTARGYNESEKLIGYALEKVGREKFYLTTKSRERTYEGIKKELEISMNNLNVNYLDLFQFHNVRTKEDYNILMSDEGGYKAIKEYQDKGIIKEIGITSHSVEILEMAVETDYFATIQYPYNAVEDQGESVFKRAKERDIGVIVMKPLAGGAISKGELALRYIMENENVTVAIPGMESVEQVIENTSVGINMRPLTKEEREELGKETSTLDKEFCRRCGYCAPCTKGIDIPRQFTLESYYLRYDLQDWATSRYRAMDINAKDCIKCGKCEPRCPYNLPIMDMLERVENNLGE